MYPQNVSHVVVPWKDLPVKHPQILFSIVTFCPQKPVCRSGCGPRGPSPAQSPPTVLPPPQGFTAIHFAAQSGKLPCLQLLVEEYQFPVDLPTSSGQTPLHLVIHGDNKTMTLPCIHYLLKRGAALNT